MLLILQSQYIIPRGKVPITAEVCSTLAISLRANSILLITHLNPRALTCTRTAKIALAIARAITDHSILVQVRILITALRKCVCVSVCVCVCMYVCV